MVEWNHENINIATNALGLSRSVSEATDRLSERGLSVSVNGLTTMCKRRLGVAPGELLSGNSWSISSSGSSGAVTNPESITGSDGYHTIFISDPHFPYQNELAWEVVNAVVSELDVSYLMFGGDIADCYSISRFDKSPTRLNLLKDETDPTRRGISKTIRLANARFACFFEGNHEYRLDSYIASKAPALAGLVSMRDLLLRNHPEVEWVPYRRDKRIGKVMYAHEIGHCGIYAGRHTLMAAGHSIVFGHSHRAGIVTDGTVDGVRHFSLNTGWLGDINQVDYTHRAKTKDWVTGFGHIYTDNKTGLVWPSFVPIMGNSCYVAGKWVSV